MRRLFERISDLERRINEVESEAHYKFRTPPPPPPPKPPPPAEFYLPENRRRFEELDAKVIIDRAGNVNPRSAPREEIDEWSELVRMGFRPRCWDHPVEWLTRFG